MLKKLIVAAGLAVSLSSHASTLELEKCFVDGVKSQALCGELAVAENPSEPNGKAINLNVVVLPKFKEESKELPVMFLAGGPGQAATELAGVLNRLLSDIRQEHDIIFVDQRGTGKSNPLRCEGTKDENDQLLDHLLYNDDVVNIKDEVELCLAQFEGSHLPSYNTYQAIEDFEAVRQALGHDKIHILGGSYGTRAGFAYLKNHPESIETAILDSNAPMQLVVGFFGKSAERAFDLLVEDCTQHEACEKAFPNLKQDYLTLMSQLNKGAIEVELSHPITGETVTTYLSKSKVVEALRAPLYDLTSRQLVPYVVNKAANGDYRALATMISRSADSAEAPGSLYTGLTMNIICNEDMPRANQSDFSKDADNYFNGELGYSAFTSVCEHWPNWQAPADFAEPVDVNVPVLLFSGKYDPVTPPAYGEMALETLPNAKHVVIENGSHVASIRMCVDSISQFIKGTALSEIDLSCAEQSIPKMFFTNNNELR